jgi:hypothetical protein
MFQDIRNLTLNGLKIDSLGSQARIQLIALQVYPPVTRKRFCVCSIYNIHLFNNFKPITYIHTTTVPL